MQIRQGRTQKLRTVRAIERLGPASVAERPPEIIPFRQAEKEFQFMFQSDEVVL